MKKVVLVAGSLIGAGLVAVSGMGIASAAANNSSGDIGKSGIPRTVFREDRLEAVAQVLNTSTTNIQTARKDKTLSQLINLAGLTNQTFVQKVKAELTTDLENQGYSQDQVTIALQHRTIARLRHHKA